MTVAYPDMGNKTWPDQIVTLYLWEHSLEEVTDRWAEIQEQVSDPYEHHYTGRLRQDECGCVWQEIQHAQDEPLWFGTNIMCTRHIDEAKADALRVMERMRHNHVTRDIKVKGKCPACDMYHASHA